MVLLIAHRGLRANTLEVEPIMENTAAAIFEAVSQGYRAVEVDVQLTKDKVPVLWHDDAVYLGNHKAIPVPRLSYRKMAKLVETSCTLYKDGGKWSCSQPKTVDTLESIIALFPSLVFNIEIKVPECMKNDAAYKYDLVHAVVQKTKLCMYRNVVLSSFDRDACVMARVMSSFKVMLLTKKELGNAARQARKYKLDGVVFDAQVMSMNKQNTHGLVWWCYNGTSPMASGCIVDHATNLIS